MEVSAITLRDECYHCGFRNLRRSRLCYQCKTPNEDYEGPHEGIIKRGTALFKHNGPNEAGEVYESPVDENIPTTA